VPTVPGRAGPDAAVFDLDGVLTYTARVHAAAWKELFDEYLRLRAERGGEPFRPFDADADYRAYVDGRLRSDGVKSFLASRGITLPLGDHADPPERETIEGLGNRKNQFFRDWIQRHGVEVDLNAVDFVRELREGGVRVGVASSSENTALILDRAGLNDLFEARVDGVLSERLGLAGKPRPDIFLECLDLLGVPDAGRALVAEDAIVGVEAGRAGGFGLVLGVDHGGSEDALREHGADWVIRSFREISLALVTRYFEGRQPPRPNTSTHRADLGGSP
jgi:trehalose 6-phosphate phosphatase